jgi:hypothetical protein
MKKYLLCLLMVLMITTGYSTPPGYEIASCLAMTQADEIASCLAMTGDEIASSTETMKVPIYSVPLPAENKIVLVRDSKGFVERAIRHNMEYLAIKPSDKGEYWELAPVFYEEGDTSFSMKKKEDTESDAPAEEILRVVAVKDFVRYN